jgi:hypothetical protein
LPPRLAINIAYAQMVSLTDDRKALDEELYAPVDGWEAADARLWQSLGMAASAGED